MSTKLRLLERIIRREVRRQLAESADLENIKNVSFKQLVNMIYSDWKNVSPYAEPYLSAMSTMRNPTDRYGFDDGYSIIMYFLSNASQWKGPVAKAVKAELKRRAKG
jgi:hypothetical protein